MIVNTLNVAEIKDLVNEVKLNKGEPKYGEGIVLLKNYSQGMTSNGNPKYSGVIANQDEEGFQIWNNKPAFATLEAGGFKAGESVVYITYEIGIYGLIINTIELAEGYNPDDFIYHKYEKGEKLNEFCQAIKDSGATEKAYNIIKTVLHVGCNDNVENRLLLEFAALSHHDNCQTGLLAHMTKCIQLYNGIKPPYSFLRDERVNDLMVIALALHDIGKIWEMYNGTYQKYSFVTHRGLGMEYLLYYKNAIIESYDDEFFYMLYSVIHPLT